MAIAVARRDQNPTQFENGFAKVEWLEGSHPLVKAYKCILKAGHTVKPETYEKKTVVFLFSRGAGYVSGKNKAHNIEGVCFYLPNFDQESYTIYAASDMEFMMVVVDMLESDLKAFDKTHMLLPYFKRVEDATEYLQDCKGPNTRSWSMIPSGMCARVLAGIVKADGEGTVEKGHPAVHQWNYTLPGSDFTLTVGDESIHHTENEWSFVPAGIDHSLVSEPGKSVYYVWFEIKTKELED